MASDPPPGDANLTEAEAAVYDRQLRVWGVETQRKLTRSRVLIVGCTGVTAEVGKNLVLAGVGSLSLVDDTPCGDCASGNFLVPADVDPACTVAEASVATLREMNPLVKVEALAGSPSELLTADSLQGFNVLLLVGQPAHMIDQADQACAAAGVAFYAACSRGIFGWVFSDLHDYNYAFEKTVEQEDGTKHKVTEARSLSFVPWRKAMKSSASGRSLKRISPLFLVLRVCVALEHELGRAVCAADMEALLQRRSTLCEAEALPASAVNEQALTAYATAAGEMPAINAVLGGVVANDILKAVSGKGEPLINNLFLYSLIDGGGWVERAG